ncbi:MAG: hypothetical protein NTU51_00615 [Bacteroidetes bacterium]|nr:hypothetical protein [Bacteroidota bacterium]
MKTQRFYIHSILTILLAFSFITAGAQFIALARKIKSSHTQNAAISVVVLDAKTSKVYRAMTDTVTTAPKIKMTGRDDAKKAVSFTTGTAQVKMKVDSLDRALCQITVSATDSVQPSTKTMELTVNAIQGVCKKLGIKCSVEVK